VRLTSSCSRNWGRACFAKLSEEDYRQLFDENLLKFEAKWEPHT
jgi:hypothetical protein